MKTKLNRVLLVLIGLSVLSSEVSALAQPTAFTYQGRLNEGTNPANGLYDLRFTLHDDPLAGNAIGLPLTNSAVLVNNGLFSTTLDYGQSVFDGRALWLQIAVRAGSAGAFTVLSPRQLLQSTPYAIQAVRSGSATTVTGPVSAGQIAGTFSSSNIGPGTITSASFAPGALAAGLAAEGLSAVPAAQAVFMSTLGADPGLLQRGYVAQGAPVLLRADGWTPVTVPGTAGSPLPSDLRYSVWTGTEFIAVGTSGTGARYDPSANLWRTLPTPPNWTGNRFDAATVWTGSEMIIWGGVAGSALNTGYRYHRASNTWSTTRADASAPTPRQGAAAVWTGSRMVIWGGAGPSGPLSTGGQYDPVADSWTSTRAGTSAPPGASYAAAVWTGSRMVVWGGYGSNWQAVATGGWYDPAGDTWRITSTTGTPPPAGEVSALWRGFQMFVWGGSTDGSDPSRITPNNAVSTGGIYYTNYDAWQSIAGVPPSARVYHLAVWDGATSVLVWGGLGPGPTRLADGKILTSGGWGAAIQNTAGAPTPSSHPIGAWLPASSEMLVVTEQSAARYRPATATWNSASFELANGQSRRQHTAVWTGSEMLVWGGTVNGVLTNSGVRYNPVTDAWTATSLAGAPSPRIDYGAAWSGTELIVWGGMADGGGLLSNGARYNPATDTWTPMASPPAAPQTPWGYSMRNGRFGHVGVWTPSGFVVWGGSDGYDNQGQELPTIGAFYQPRTDTWWSFDSANYDVPGRYKPSGVCVQGRAYFVGGRKLDGGSPLFDSALAWDPENDAWLQLPASPVPLDREGFSITEAGGQVVVWGGRRDDGTSLSTGAAYLITSNTWAALPDGGAPGARSGHSAVWSGRELIIWGGTDGSGVALNSGYRLELDTRQWSALPQGPTIANGHSAIWSGGEMILYGNLGSFSDRCARYRPPLRAYYYLKP